MKFKMTFIIIIFGFTSLIAQDVSDKRTDLGVSVQLYPAGIIPTVNLEYYLEENASLLFRLGLNIVDRQDFSDFNLTEEGTGFGGSVGYRRHFPSGKGKFIAGLNIDIWSLTIDWTDVGPADGIVAGSTYTLVIQPWLEGGYFLPIKHTKSQIGLTLGFGREINAITSGDEVEQGFIGSVSLQYSFRL
uniref:hypothetical protein n=2 Tax=uncultured Croceitalea sp. TaxID=1798908 RepID=UPI003306329A